MISISELVEKSRELPVLPASVTRLAAVIADPQSTIDEIVEAIRFDQSLTGAVLREANSAISASRRTIVNLKDAVIRIGGARILSRSISKTLKIKLAAGLPGYGYGEQELWRHGVAAAVAAEELCAFVNVQAQGLVFTAALLHDIGKLIMENAAPPEAMRSVWEGVSRRNKTCEESEQAVFGFSHAVIGGEIIKAWNLPEAIEKAVRRHHSSEACSEPDQCTDMVMVSNIIAHAMGEGLGYEGMSVSIDDDVTQRIGIRREDFERICSRAAGSFSRTLELYT
jgi:putative nucleotidyltransferase with HDIG domain